MSTTNVEVATVRKYCGYARGICTALLLFFLAGLCFLLLKVLPGAAPPGAKFWLAVLGLSVALTAGFTYLLRRLFDNMAHGEIFSNRNVEQIRRIAYIFLGVGALRVLGPLTYKILVINGIVEPGAVDFGLGAGISGAFVPCAVAGVLLLASWIMRVGLGLSREAAELRHDAELVV
jgi:hypothetical protein